MSVQDTEIRFKVGCEYKIYTSKKGEDNLKERTPWFFNHLTDLGLDQLASNGAWRRHCQIGAGSATPLDSDIALQSRLASVDSTQNMPAGTIDTVNRWLSVQLIYTFPAGIMGGNFNVSEVGVGSASSGGLTSRALILDSLGAPTSISVQEDEDLVVAWRLWVRQPTEDVFSGEVSGRDAVMRACNVNTNGTNYLGWRYHFSSGAAIALFSLASEGNTQHIFNGAISAITGVPSGLSEAISGPTVATYVAGSRRRVLTYNISNAQGNWLEGISSLAFKFGPGSWQLGITPPIKKTSLQTARIIVYVTWDREGGV